MTKKRKKQPTGLRKVVDTYMRIVCIEPQQKPLRRMWLKAFAFLCGRPTVHRESIPTAGTLVWQLLSGAPCCDLRTFPMLSLRLNSTRIRTRQLQLPSGNPCKLESTFETDRKGQVVSALWLTELEGNVLRLKVWMNEPARRRYYRELNRQQSVFP